MIYEFLFEIKFLMVLMVVQVAYGIYNRNMQIQTRKINIRRNCWN